MATCRAGALDDDDLFAPMGISPGAASILAFERNDLAAAHAFIGGDDKLGLAILDAVGEAIRRKAAEHHGMDGADARAGQHGVGGLGDHRHVDGDAVALLDAVLLQHIGEAADFDRAARDR